MGRLAGRGNGALVLTKDACTSSDLSAAETYRSHQGHHRSLIHQYPSRQATMYNLLKVRFMMDDKPDSIAWYLSDPGAWKTHIEQLALPSFSFPLMQTTITSS